MNNIPMFYNYPTTFVTMQINTHHPAIANWSTQEKYELMKALRPNDLDINLLLEKIPTKTRAEIEAAIKFYVSIAKHHPMLAPPPPPPKPQKKDKKRKASALNDRPDDTLRELEEELKEIMPTNALVVETAAAVRMISEYDVASSMETNHSIDCQDVYKEIANVMQSTSGTRTAESTVVLNKHSEETAVRVDVLDSEMTEMLKNIKVPKRNVSVTASASTSAFGLASGSTYGASASSSFPSTSAMASTSAAVHPANNRQQVIRRDMATQHSYNTMNVSEAHLRTPAGSFDFNKDL
ncbi:unnamed protein product [Spodoptera exigua]|nr:unnamed protein product [Spodoptera exigua]